MPHVVLKSFHRRLRELDYTRERMEKLHAAGRIRLRDLESVYEALFLRAVTNFEVFLEELFFAILERKIRYSNARASLRIQVRSSDALRDILLQGDKYLDWLPFTKTEKRARLYLEDGGPFCTIGEAARQTIQTITTIRHAIAHSSGHSKREFLRQVIGSQSLLRGERTPAGYLRSRIRNGPIKNRFQVYVGELGKIAVKLC